MSSKFKRIQAMLLIFMMLPFSVWASGLTDAHTVSVIPSDVGNVNSTSADGYAITTGSTIKVVTDNTDPDWIEPHTGDGVIVTTLNATDYENIFTFTHSAACEQPLIAGNNYVLSFWVNDPDNCLINVYLQNQMWYPEGGWANVQYSSTPVSVPDVTGWQKVYINFTPTHSGYTTTNPDGNDYSALNFRVNTLSRASAGKIYIDDVSLVEVPGENVAVTDLVNKEYVWDSNGTDVIAAKFTFNTDYVDESSVVALLDSVNFNEYSVEKTTENSQSIITVTFNQPIAKSRLTFDLRDIWARSITDNFAVDSKYITSFWAPDISNATASFNDSGFIVSSAVSGYQFWKGDASAIEIDSTVYRGDSGSSYKLSLADYPVGTNKMFRMRAIYVQNPLQTGKTYQLSYWIKKDTHDIINTYPYLIWKYDVATSTVQSITANSGDAVGTIADTTEWQKVSHTFTYTDAEQPTSTRLYELIIDIRSSAFDSSIQSSTLSSGNLWIDDIKFVEVPAENQYPASFTSSSPSVSDGGVAVTTPATFNFNGIVDYKDLSAANVLINGEAQKNSDVEIFGHYDLDSRTSVIKVLPASGKWTSDTEFTVSLQNVKDMWGRSYTGDTPSASFITLPNVNVTYDFYLGNSAINQLQEGTVICKATVTSNTSDVTEAMFVMALCKNNTIQSYDIVKAENLVVDGSRDLDDASVTLTLAAGESLSDYSVRCFILDNINSLKAIDKNVEIFR